jgi:hypothetical protein
MRFCASCPSVIEDYKHFLLSYGRHGHSAKLNDATVMHVIVVAGIHTSYKMCKALRRFVFGRPGFSVTVELRKLSITFDMGCEN